MPTIEGWDSVPSQQPLQIFLQNAFWLIQLPIMCIQTSEEKSFQFFYCSKWMIWHSIPKVIEIKVLVHNLFVCLLWRQKRRASPPVGYGIHRPFWMLIWHLIINSEIYSMLRDAIYSDLFGPNGDARVKGLLWIPNIKMQQNKSVGADSLPSL